MQGVVSRKNCLAVKIEKQKPEVGIQNKKGICHRLVSKLELGRQPTAALPECSMRHIQPSVFTLFHFYFAPLPL